MSTRLPHLPPVESVKSRMVEVLTKMAGKPAGTGRQPAAPGPANLAPAVIVPEIPPSIARMLIQLANNGVSMDIFAASDALSVGPRSHAYTVAKDAPAHKVQTISTLVRAIGEGSVTVEEFNRFVEAFLVPSEIVREALTGISQDAVSKGITLNDTLYRLVAGRLVASRARESNDTSRLWLNTAAIVAAAALLAAAIIRSS